MSKPESYSMRDFLFHFSTLYELKKNKLIYFNLQLSASSKALHQSLRQSSKKALAGRSPIRSDNICQQQHPEKNKIK